VISSSSLASLLRGRCLSRLGRRRNGSSGYVLGDREDQAEKATPATAGRSQPRPLR
jgi:hypothetical protein